MVLAGILAGAKTALARAVPFASGFISGVNTKKLADNVVAGAGGYAYFHLLAKDKSRKGFTKKFSALRHLGPVALLAVADAYIDNDMLHSATQGAVGAMVYHWSWSKWVEEYKPAYRTPSRKRTSPVLRRRNTKLVMERPYLTPRPLPAMFPGGKPVIGLPIKFF